MSIMKTISNLFLAITLSLNVFSSSATESKLYCMKGFVNKSPATMFLGYISNEGGESFFGSYYYDTIMLPIELNGYNEDGNVALFAYYGSHEEKFEGKFSETEYSGYWTSGNKKYSFKFTINDELQSNFSWLFFRRFKYLKNEGEPPFSSHYEAVAFPKENIKNYNTIRNEVFEADSEDEMLKKITKTEADFEGEDEVFIMNDGSELILSSGYWRCIIPIFMNNDFIIFESYLSMYLGETHYIDEINYFTYDLNNNKKVKLSDILIDTNSTELKEIIYNKYIEKYGAEAIKYLFKNKEDLDVPEVFYITPNNITFSYGKTDMNAYAYGIISVSVPLEKIKKFLTEYAINTFIK